jgi:hypothetical protein
MANKRQKNNLLAGVTGNVPLVMSVQQYVPTKSSKAKPSAAQVAQQARQRNISSAWSGLSMADKYTWEAASNQYQTYSDTGGSDNLGGMRYPSPINMFSSLAHNRLALGLAIQGAFTPAMGVVYAAPPNPAIGNIGTLADVTDANIPDDANTKYKVYISDTIHREASADSASTRVFGTAEKGSEIAAMLNAPFIAAYGRAPFPGERVKVTLLPLHKLTGVPGLASEFVLQF